MGFSQEGIALQGRGDDLRPLGRGGVSRRVEFI